jgi:phage-related tail protein
MDGDDLTEQFSTELTFVGSQIINGFRLNKDLHVTSSYIDKITNEEVEFELDPNIFQTESTENGIRLF